MQMFGGFIFSFLSTVLWDWPFKLRELKCMSFAITDTSIKKIKSEGSVLVREE